MAKSTLDILEQQEQIQLLIDHGYGDFVDTMLSNESQCYTKKGRVNKSGICRVKGCNNKQLEDTLKACRKILSNDDEE
jgi:hypothetical protein